MSALLFLFSLLQVLLTYAEGGTRYYDFNVTKASVTRLCTTKSVYTVNGQFPGPEIHVNEGDTVVIKLRNQVDVNVTLHWHGMFQNRTGWYDGPEYITQCPLKPGATYTYKFAIQDQRGTLWWHAHIMWMRATVHGAFIIHPKPGVPFPFAEPYKEVPILLGEWWNKDVQDVLDKAVNLGGPPEASDAFTINSLPGHLYNCSSKDVFTLRVKKGKTYLLRIVNAGLNTDQFFAIAGHKLTIVEADASYVKPFTTGVLHLAPGQTVSALLSADQAPGTYYIATRTSNAAAFVVPTDLSIGTGFVHYIGHHYKPLGKLPHLPAPNDTDFVFHYNKRFRSIVRHQVMKAVDKHLLFTFGLNLMTCPPWSKCDGLVDGVHGKLAASVNNASFTWPDVAFLKAHFMKLSGVYSDLPEKVPFAFNFTGTPLKNIGTRKETTAFTLPYGTNVQIILQGTSFVVPEIHPIHLHGYNFYVMGQGFGNYDPSCEASFNLVDPPIRNTIGIPPGGWTAIRFRADNPGTWFFHCHLDMHTVWGLGTVLRVLDGEGPLQSLEPPPEDYPPC